MASHRLTDQMAGQGEYSSPLLDLVAWHVRLDTINYPSPLVALSSGGGGGGGGVGVGCGGVRAGGGAAFSFSRRRARD